MLELTVALGCEPVLLKHIHVGSLHELAELLEAAETLDLGVDVHNQYVSDGADDALVLEWIVDLYDEVAHTTECDA